jgi:hypothetical protein
VRATAGCPGRPAASGILVESRAEVLTMPAVAFSHFGIHVTDLAGMVDIYTASSVSP